MSSTPRNPAHRSRDLPEQAVRSVRSVRAGILASTSLAVGAAAHAGAGGHVPGGTGLILLGALAVVLCVLVARARARVVVLVPFLALLQYVLHEGFMRLGSEPHTMPPGHGSMAGGSAAMAGMPDAVGPGMLLLHALAVVVTAVALAASERSLAGAAAVWAWLLPALRGLVQPVVRVRRGPAPAASGAPLPLARAVRSVAPRRGPPVGLALA